MTKLNLYQYKHWNVEEDGALVHKKNGYDITLNWLMGFYGTMPPESHISHKNWATQEVIDELKHYKTHVIKMVKDN